MAKTIIKGRVRVRLNKTGTSGVPIGLRKKALTKQIKNVIKSQSETKYETEVVLNATAFNSVIASAAECYNVMPRIGLGTTSYQRIGQKITPMKCRVDLSLGFSQDDVTSRDITAHVFMLRAKSIKAARLIGNIPITDFLDAGGSGGSVAFLGTLPNAMLPVEKSNFTVLHHRKIHLQKVDTTDLTVASQNANSSKKLSLTYKPRQLVFDETLDPNYAENDFIFMCIGYVYNSPDHVPDVLNTALLVTAVSHFYYKDT